MTKKKSGAAAGGAGREEGRGRAPALLGPGEGPAGLLGAGGTIAGLLDTGRVAESPGTWQPTGMEKPIGHSGMTLLQTFNGYVEVGEARGDFTMDDFNFGKTQDRVLVAAMRAPYPGPEPSHVYNLLHRLEGISDTGRLSSLMKQGKVPVRYRKQVLDMVAQSVGG